MPSESRRLHIALWAPGWPLSKHHNGIVTYVHWLKDGAEKLGHRVSILTRSVDGTFPDVTRIGTSLWQRIKHRALSRSNDERVLRIGEDIAAAIRRLHRRDPIDIIEMEESFGWCADVARLTSIPTVVKLHGPAFLSLIGPELQTPFARAKIEREGQALRRMQTITSPSSRTLAQTVERYGLSAPRMCCIFNPMGDQQGLPLWSLSACDRDTILFVGRFDQRKGGDIVLRCFAALATSHPRLKLIFVGPDNGVPDANGSPVHFQAYVEQTIPASCRGRIQYLGARTVDEISRLRTQAMVTLVASRWENLGYALLEAMLQGCPVVCSDAGGCPEVVTHDVNGKLAASENVNSFAEQVAALLREPALADRLGGAARAHIMQHYSADTVTVQTLDLYGQVLGRGGLNAPANCTSRAASSPDRMAGRAMP